jgi:menaquinone-dependent protoporphyrinogen oxidase
MAKILVVYGTAYGQTERIARRIVNCLTSRGHGVCIYKGDCLPNHLRLDDFDACVIAGSIIRGRHQRYIRDFARRNRGYLNSVRSAFASVSGAAQGSPEQARGYLDEFLQETGWQPRFAASFAGAMAYTQYGPLLRWITRVVSRRRGGPTDTTRDHDFTDWVAVDRFAERLAKALPPSPEAERVENLLVRAGHQSA